MNNLMKTVMASVVWLMAGTTGYAQINELPRSVPEAEGVESGLIMDFFDGMMGMPQTEIHSIMVLRHGKVIAEMYAAPFEPEYGHTVFSASKTFTSAAIGIAIGENRLRVTDRVASFFPELLPERISDDLAEMTIHDLLIMGSCINLDQTVRGLESDWLKAYFAKGTQKPGEKFRYDSIATYTLSAIIQKVTGMTLLDYLKIKLFEPLGIKDVNWEISPDGITTGGWGLHIQSESLAKFGQLLLDKGMWNGERIISEEWVGEMMKNHIDTGTCGYGYQMWVEGYPGTARADGAYGQYVIVVPAKDMVFVVTELTTVIGNGSLQKNLIWDLIPKISDGALPPSKEYAKLARKSSDYALPKMKGKSTSSLSRHYNNRTYTLEENYLGWDKISFSFGKNLITAHITERDGNTFNMVFGHNTWEKTTISTCPPAPLVQYPNQLKGLDVTFMTAGNYAWPAKDSLRLKVYYVNWISSIDITVRFEDSGIIMNVTQMFDQHTFIKGAL